MSITADIINDSIIGRPARDAARWLSLQRSVDAATLANIRTAAAQRRNSHLINAQITRLARQS